MPFYWGSADGEQSGMAAVHKSFALVVGFLAHCRCCCYSLSMTFNEEFTDSGFDLQSELRAKKKKFVVPFAREVTISLLDWSGIESCWWFLQQRVAVGHSPVRTVQFACASALNIHTHVSIFRHSNPFGIPVSLLSSFPTMCMCKWKDNHFV